MLLFAILALLIIPIIPIILSQYTYHYFFHLALARIPKFRGDVIIHDPNLTAEIVAQGLRSPSTMTFLGPNDILVLEKNNGTVQRIVNGKMLPRAATTCECCKQD